MTYRDLKHYWGYATKEEIEYINAYLQDDFFDFFVVNVGGASRQGGIVLIIDKQKVIIVHISERSFAEVSLI